MRVEREGPGVIVIRERWTVMRLAFLAGAALVPGLLALCPAGACSAREWGGGLVLAAVLGAIGFLVEDQEVRFDPGARRVAWLRRRVVGARTDHIPFADIRDVLVRPETTRDAGDRRAHTTWWLELVTSTTTHRLTRQGAFHAEEFATVAALLRAVLGLPAPQPDAIARLAAAGHVLEAVALARREQGLSLEDATAMVEQLRRSSADHQDRERTR